MDKISQILDNIKDRLSSPFIFSFIVAWFVINWPITLALFWYDPPVNSQGHLSLIYYVGRNINFVQSFCYPFVVAIGYTFAYPFFKNLISAFQTWISKKEEERNLKILKGSKVSIDKYLSLRENLKKRTEDLEKLYDSESITQKKLNELTDALNNERSSHLETRTLLSDARAIIGQFSNVSIIEGRWIRRFKSGTKTISENIQIQNSMIYLDSGSLEHKYNIQDFNYSSSSKRLLFVLANINSSNPQNFFSLNILNYRSNKLTGIEHRRDESVEIEYIKEI